MGTVYNRLMNNLDELKLYAVKDSISQYIDLIASGEKDLTEGLYELSEKEKDLRKERALAVAVQMAGFPFHKKVSDYDFSFQPSLKKEEISTLLTLRFLEEKGNILFVGSPGTGKTHLATAIGIEAAGNHYSVRFISCQQLIEQLKSAEKENRLEKRLKYYSGFKLLIIDEIGYLNLDLQSANLFFQLISLRYEKHSTIITTNKSLSKWSEIFADAVITNAILDRLLHHAHIVNIIGPSYRTKDILNQLEKKD